MTGDRDLAMLIGNGLSIAFSNELLLGSISQEMTTRFTAEYTGSDAVARAMQKVAQHQPTGDPVTDFEVLIGAFGGQSDILEDLAVFADLTKNSDKEIANAIQKVRDFVSEVQRRGIGHTLQIISERSYSDTARRQPLRSFFESVLSTFQDCVTVANLNYDTLVLSVLAETYWRDLTDMANGRYDAGTVKVGGIPYRSWPLRTAASEFMPFEQRRIRLLHLHGSLTYWRFGPDDYRKLPIEAVRSQIWEIFRNENTFTGRPLVVLANQHEKADHVTKYPYDLAYRVAESGFKDANNWLIVGYSFRDICVNDMLSRCWEARANPPQILVVTNSDRLEAETVEDAFGWEHGSAAAHNLAIERTGAFGLAASSGWSDFTSGL
ncbi:SIR2 family protein [Mycobacterium sp. E183]|nr:SIR2 family protein [Mycobacterium sp. E183]OBG55183.1 hypothetical protein A5703_07940 [Mycobacterium sp. E188]OBH37904.1 hypothetical protein A5691_25395 [Mycobacterium sp. E183]